MFMKLSVAKASAMLVALNALDGYEDGGVRRLFKLGAVRLTIARAISKLAPVLETYQQAVNALLRETSGGAESIDPQAESDPAKRDEKQRQLATFNVEREKMWTAEHDIEFPLIAVADLNLAENPISLALLAALDPVL